MHCTVCGHTRPGRGRLGFSLGGNQGGEVGAGGVSVISSIDTPRNVSEIKWTNRASENGKTYPKDFPTACPRHLKSV